VSVNGNGGELSTFLRKLSEDRELQQTYMKDPDGTLRQAGLSDDALEAALSRDLGKIKGVLERELGDPGIMVCMTITEPPA
jgi:hypothetical protein